MESMEPRFGRLEVRPAYRVVSDTLQREIESGKLKPGDQLPTETSLASQLGVNRSTVREGIRLLEQSGMIRREGGKRLAVVLPHFRDLASRATRALVMHNVSFRELWEASMAIEPRIAALAAERAGPADIAALGACMAEMERVRADNEAFVRCDMRFHDLLAQAAGNQALELAREPIGLLFRPAGQIILPRLQTHQRVVDAHVWIHDAVCARDVARAFHEMSRHMADFRRGFERTGVNMEAPLRSGSASIQPRGDDEIA
jgi:GntR family transcriptional regulator, transcriptional repressor for pyruvate dehydrogenase complex